ncbi:aldose 1-epimerase family protein [Corynebacterium sp. 335C]
MDGHDVDTREDVRISAGDYSAAITPYGGGPRELTHRGEPLLVGSPGEVARPGEAAVSGPFPPMTAQCVLAPWPNRVGDGVFAHRGEIHRLEITEAPRATAIHGFAASRRWDVAEAGEPSATLTLDVGPEPGWPWPLRLTARWSLDAERGLVGELGAENLSDSACPLGLGWHPYLSARGAALDDCTLHAPVSTFLPLDPVRNLPVGPEAPADAAAPGLAAGAPMAGLWLDHCFGGVVGSDRDDSAGVEARLVGPDGRGVRLTADPRFRWLQIFTADPARREGFPGVGRAVAVEPMTCPPDALRSGRDLVTLEPGESLTLNVGICAFDA